MKKLEFGIGASDPTRSWADTEAVVKQAEDCGFDSVCMWDHPNFAGVDVQSGLAALAKITDRIRLWANVFAVPFRAPTIVGKFAASLDVISNGRLIVGLGTGWDEREFEALGIPFEKKSTRNQLVIDTIHILRTMWTQESATYKGKTWSMSNMVCEPKPVQRPGPPIWVGSHGGPKAIREVIAPLADGWNLGIPSDPDAPPVETTIARFKETCQSIGRDPEEVTISVNVLIQGSTAGSSLKAMYSGHIGETKLLALQNSGKIQERIGELADVGVSHFMLGLRTQDPLGDLPQLASTLQAVAR